MMDFVDLFSSSNSTASSTPRTPSPRTSIDDGFHPSPESIDFVAPSDLPPPPPSQYFHQDWYASQHQTQHQPFWPQQHVSSAAVQLPAARGFLADLYDSGVDDLKEHRPTPDSMYLSPPGGIFRADWDLGGSVGGSSAESSPSVHTLAPPSEPAYYRRASYPYVRHDDVPQNAAPPAQLMYSSRHDALYGEPLPIDSHQPLSADPAHLHGRPLDDQYMASHDIDSEGIKMESSSPAMVPTQAYYRPPQQGPMPGVPPTYMTHAGAIPIMHTDDAASKETQYLRRRCFNCHTTEPPSWRRSTLNPGKIVCNKCGLYERTHLRPRPHRFDELRATNKARKAAAKAGQHVPSPITSPKPQQPGMVKKEPQDEYDAGMRRASTGSSTVSNGVNGNDWDANVPRVSHSPPSQIRLPSLPSAQLADGRMARGPEKSATTPYAVESGPGPHQTAYFDRRPSLPVPLDSVRPRDNGNGDAQHWQRSPAHVAELEDDRSRKTTPN
ncbi:hypothetical protein AURDEDRAFT_110463 [Auricularia subglabra TFB-10046 SS5]|nr:hypothetical protein AURDEDRAFT_110463 [Auricularia subglabra TFB-10046 SS5]